MTERYGGMDEHCPYCGAEPFEHCAPDCLEREEPLDIEQAQQFTEQDEAAWSEVVARLNGPTMTRDAFESLRDALKRESISYGELALIESVFDTIPDSLLRDLRENAMASDMLDEIERLGLVR